MITFTVKQDGGAAFEVTAESRDVLAWERAGRNRSFSELESMQDIYSLAHLACMRQQLFTGSLSEFEDTVSIDVVDDDEDVEPDPTRKDRSPDRSSRSRSRRG